MAYLTNTLLRNEECFKYAAEQSGMDVEFHMHPIPKDPYDPEDEFYHPETMEGLYGSVYTNQPNEDHSAFWEAWDKYDGSN